MTTSRTATRRWRSVAQDAAACTRCELYRDATATVFGAGPVPAPVLLVGEQPGDVEDRRGEPFVGPAGAVLRRCMERVGLDPADTYLTNAVKHFRWEARGKRRIHQRPGIEHVRACHVWLEAELELVDPQGVVLLGAVAAGAFDRSIKVTRDRGTVRDVPGLEGRRTLVTVHPSSVLRARDRAAAEAAFVEDLRVLPTLLD